MTILKKTLAAAFTVAALGTGLAATTTSASASPYYKPYWHHPKWHHGWGWGAAGFAGGLALGALAASSAPTYYGECYFTRREVVDRFGNVYIRRVRVCE
ncbi:hypothetical protein QNA08_07040 [Chelatococcus sp. SYSU_G07232]|uniref:Sulfur globule protein n=1 Tax=Chelatococcus albus TaxID=3047466 RepID=A0ABT7AG44_9HYPH|nr:hypothetical protein [Chelatococcus sp. SYSU_G07232]MDJ1157987.1 hypothetical protein [Chelatococcus sp. SYSU_G07232]